MNLTDSLQARRGFTNFIRLAAAVAVLVSHSYPITGAGPDPGFGGTALGEIAVSCFFVLSGYFVFTSSRRHSLRVYSLLRIARLIPALFVVNLFSGLLIAPLLSQSWRIDWLDFSNGPLSYIFYNTTLLFKLQPEVANVFVDVPYKSVINGSLWTLPTELRSYILCAIIAFLCKKSSSLVPLYVLYFALFLFFSLSQLTELNQLAFLEVSSLRLLLIFFTGALLSTFKTFFLYSKFISFCVFVMFALILYFNIYLISTFAYGFLPFLLGKVPVGITSRFTTFSLRDYSYGFYLWAFPIQQMLMGAFGFLSPFDLILISVPLTLIAAVCSWHMLEKPILARARKHVGKL
jgi:peptidoglycan/LPS O-acetylase OafA/YrhL